MDKSHILAYKLLFIFIYITTYRLCTVYGIIKSPIDPDKEILFA